jgi:hypothetical protein
MDASLFLPSPSIAALHQQSSQDSSLGTSKADNAIPLHVLNSTAAEGIYSRLRGNDIRFVVLQAGEPTDPIKCTLTAGHIDALPRYEAVSYVWGSQVNPQKIDLNGVLFFITQNLHKALTRLRTRTEDRLLWIDALTVNQSDILERNAQVRKMLTIYNSAEAVLAYIGDGNEDLGEPSKFWAVLNEPPNNLKIPNWDCLLDQEQGRDPIQLFYTFKWLDQYEFWSRAWIIQEIAGINVVFILGPHRITYERLWRVWAQLVAEHYLLYNVSHGENPEDCFNSIGSRISAIMLNTARMAQLSLKSWLKSFILMDNPRCSDPHDKIYAFYGLFAPEIQNKISIDYNMPVEDLFTLMTKVYIEKAGNLWLLSFVEVSSRYCSATPTVNTALPSWAFNFAGEISYFSRWHLPICDKGIKPKDSKTTRLHHRFEMDGRPRLHVKGVCIGQVHQVDRSPRHKLFMGISFELSKWNLGVISSEEGRLCSALLGSFAEPKDFSNILPYDYHSLDKTERKYWSKGCAALNAHYERLLFSYIPEHRGCPSNENGSYREFALGHPGVLTGDKLCLVLGCPIPLLLRKAGNGYTVVGSSYAQGYMEGDAMDALGIGIDSLQDFCLC